MCIKAFHLHISSQIYTVLDSDHGRVGLGFFWGIFYGFFFGIFYCFLAFDCKKPVRITRIGLT